MAALPDVPVMGRLSLFLRFWRSLMMDKWVLEVVAYGHCFLLQLWKIVASAMAEEFADLLQKGAVSVVQHKGQLVLHLFNNTEEIGQPLFHPQPEILQPLQIRQRFRMETLNTIVGVVPPGCWVAWIYPPGLLGGLDRPDGCLLPRGHPPGILLLLMIFLEWLGLPNLSHVIRPTLSPKDLHQAPLAPSGLPRNKRNLGIYLPG
jgi:hypothetical protein